MLNRILLPAVALFCATGANAQAAQDSDVIVIRRVIAPASEKVVYTPVFGQFGEWSSTCSNNAVRTAENSCIREPGGTPVDIKFCGIPQDVTERQGVYSGCTGEWTVTWTEQTQCLAGKKLEGSTVSCTSGNMCDPRTRPTPSQSREVTCVSTKVTCGDFQQGKAVRSAGSHLGGVSKLATYQQAVDFCQNLSAQVGSCTIQKYQDKFYADAYAANPYSELFTYNSGPSVTYYSSLCRP